MDFVNNFKRLRRISAASRFGADPHFSLASASRMNEQRLRGAASHRANVLAEDDLSIFCRAKAEA